MIEYINKWLRDISSVQNSFYESLIFGCASLCCCVAFSPVASSGGYSLVHRLLIEVASSVVEHRLSGA